MSERTWEHRFLSIPISAFGVSLGLHLALMVFMVSTPLLQSLGLMEKKPLLNDVYQSFIQVDVVGLPDLLPNQRASLDTALPIVDQPSTAPEPTKEETAEEEKKDEDVIISPDPKEAKALQEKKLKEEKKKAEAAQKEKEKKRQQELDKAMKRIAEEAKREAALKALQSANGKKGRQKIAGNILSKGTSLTGAVGNAKDQYTGRIVEAIRENFNIYLWQTKNRKGLVAVVHLELWPTGKVKKRQIVKASVDSGYDSAVLQAIDSASFPVPEDPSILAEGFDITFIP